jgi:hypothetical protein
MLPVYPFAAQRYIGSISEVSPSSARANLPYASLPSARWHHGTRLGLGEVGELVVIEGDEDAAVFGRLLSVRLPEKERLSVEPELGKDREAHPVGTIQLLTTVTLRDGRVMGGVSQYPRLGSAVYTVHPTLIKWLAEQAQAPAADPPPVTIDLARLPGMHDTRVSITPERLFGRHCAVLGATGGGKSWTLARLVEQACLHQSKVLLIDATGEFHTLSHGITHTYIGQLVGHAGQASEVVFPYFELTEADLFALFKPSGQIQAPKLRAAMKSLKLAKLVGPPLASASGIIEKAQRQKAPYDTAYVTHVNAVENPHADFDATKLVMQINAECVWPNGGTGATPNPLLWGNVNEQDRSYCVSLMVRIEDMLQAGDMACIFQPGAKTPLSTVIDTFLADPEQRVLRVSLRYLSFAYNAREVVANAIGRHLITLARAGKFRDLPLLVFLDEAHQFLSKALGDENSKYPLDAYDSIAKEGRKFGLNICISTQRPRDIPEDVLSQMGTLIVHRLTNDRDREVVERASGEIDQSAAVFLPTLAPGQAIIVGVDFPIPLAIQVCEPDAKPDSKGPNYQVHWKLPEAGP